MVLRGIRRSSVDEPRRRRLLVLVGVAAFWCALVVARLLHLQVYLHDELVARAQDQQIWSMELAAQRGDILDRNGKPLAATIELQSIYAHPWKLSDRNAVAQRLAPILEMDAAALRGRLDTEAPFVWLRRKARPETVRAVRSVIAESGWSEAVGFLRESKRVYPHRSLAAQVLGFVDIDGNGQAGVELAYDEAVHGVPGRWMSLRDGGNRPIDPDGLERIEPVPGHDLRLTLDSGIQYAAETALREAIEEHEASGGSALVLDPRNGAVLAMASSPTFNPNVRDRALVDNSVNRNLAHVYEPGSTFKVVTTAAALGEGLVDENELIDCEGGTLRVASHTYRDWRLGFGVMPFSQVLMNSSNVGVIKVGLRLEPDSFHRWLRDFGLGRPTGIDLPGETSGTLHPPSRWSGLSQSSMSIGYGVSVTPLQMASVVAAVANGGWLMRPYVVAEELDGNGRSLKRTRPERRHRVLEGRTASRVAALLERVVSEGTGQPADLPGYRVAGKTGTARRVAPEGGYRGYVSSFVGYLPVESPRAVILVILDDPRNGYYGSRTAAPAFRKIARAAIRHLHIPPSRPDPAVPIVASDPAEGVPEGRSATSSMP